MHELGPLAVDALQIALLVSLPALGLALLVGACVGLLQAATQLPEPSINALSRLLVVGLALAWGARWMGEEVVRYTLALWQALPSAGP